MHMRLIHESQVFELRSETKFKVCDPSIPLTPLVLMKMHFILA